MESLSMEIRLKILKDLDIELKSKTETSWLFKIPKYRTEVYRSADIIEEILRIYGFNNVPLEKNSGSSFLAPKDENDPFLIEEAISNQLVGRSFNEIQGNSLTKPEYSFIEETFEKGYASVFFKEPKKKAKWGIIDSYGNYVLKPKYKRVSNFVNGYACCESDDGNMNEEATPAGSFG